MPMQKRTQSSYSNESCADSDVRSQMVKEVITCLVIMPSSHTAIYRIIRQSHQT